MMNLQRCSLLSLFNIFFEHVEKYFILVWGQVEKTYSLSYDKKNQSVAACRENYQLPVLYIRVHPKPKVLVDNFQTTIHCAIFLLENHLLYLLTYRLCLMLFFYVHLLLNSSFFSSMRIFLAFIYIPPLKSIPSPIDTHY